MRKCEKCGHENPDSAVLCEKCGAVFSPPAAPSSPPTKGKVPEKKYWVLRILVAAGVWVVITAISLHVAWHQAQKSDIAWYQQWRTQEELRSMTNAIAAYTEKYGTTPASFQDLVKMTNDSALPDYDSEGLSYVASEGFLDDWGHPLVFTNEGTNCVIISYGRDGSPGGVGVDHDLTTANPHPKEALPTFGQFWSNQLCGGMIASSIICGGLAGLLSLLTVRVPNLKAKGIILLVLSLGATIAGTLWTTTIITLLHIPSGH